MKGQAVFILGIAVIMALTGCSESSTGSGGPAYCKMYGSCIEIGIGMSPQDCRDADGEIVTAEVCGITPPGPGTPGTGAYCVSHEYRECVLVSDLASELGMTCAQVGGVTQNSCPAGYDNHSDPYTPSSSSGGGIPGTGIYCVDDRYEECILVSELALYGYSSCANFYGTVQNSCPAGYDNYSNPSIPSSSSGGASGYCLYYGECYDMEIISVAGLTCTQLGGTPVASCPVPPTTDPPTGTGNWCVGDSYFRDCVLVSDLALCGHNCSYHFEGTVQNSCPAGYDIWVGYEWCDF